MAEIKTGTRTVMKYVTTTQPVQVKPAGQASESSVLLQELKVPELHNLEYLGSQIVQQSWMTTHVLVMSFWRGTVAEK